MRRKQDSDGVIVWDYSYSPHDGTLTRKWSQPTRDVILERNRDLRNAKAVRDVPGMGRLALTIPLDDRERLRRKYPELDSTDAQTRTLAWKRFIASEESAPYKVSKG